MKLLSKMRSTTRSPSHKTKMLVVVSENGSNWRPWGDHLTDIDSTVVLVQQPDESEPQLTTRAFRRIDKIDHRRHAFESAIIACSEADDAQTEDARYALAEKMVGALAHGGQLEFTVDESASPSCRAAVLKLASRLSRNLKGKAISLSATLGATIWVVNQTSMIA